MSGFSFLLPRDWEITAHDLDDAEREGRFSFATEKGPMGQFSWRKINAAPDIERIIEEVHRRYLGEDTAPKIRFTRHANGRVYLAHTRQGERFYASVFNLSKMLLCEWIFDKYSKDMAELVVPMLDSFTDNAPDPATKRQFFALFGLEASLPEGYHFVDLEAVPTSVTMNFENAKHYKISVHRFGLADVYMQGADTANFYHRCLYARRYAIRDIRKLPPVNGCETVEIDYRARGKFGFDFLLGPWWHGFASAFYKKSENRIYAFEHLGSQFSKEREKLKDIFQQKLTAKD